MTSPAPLHRFAPTGRTALSHARPLPLDRFLFGACYYPEHWDAATRADDADRMRAAGFNVVRMAEFAWDLVEPAEGEFDFALFDETIAHLGKHGIDTILCTPTATPPRWLTTRHPEILRVDAHDRPMSHGSRQHVDLAHPTFRTHSRRITRAMAGHFAGNPHVIGWQTDNEFYCHMDDDHGPATQSAFREFLRRRYDETKQVGEELAKIGPALMGSSVAFDVGIAMAAYDVREADAAYPQGLPTSQDCGEAVHGEFWKRGYAVGCCHPTDLPADLKLYVIPQWLLFDPAWVEPLKRWVDAGGTLVIGARTATRDLDNQIVATTPPGCLAALAGVTVEESGCENDPARIKRIVGETFETCGERWYEVLSPAEGPETLAHWSGRHLDGHPAITLRSVGRGRVIYVGTYLTADVASDLIDTLAAQSELTTCIPNLPIGLEVVRRWATGHSLWFILNPTDEPITLSDLPPGERLVDDASDNDLPPNGVIVIRES